MVFPSLPFCFDAYVIVILRYCIAWHRLAHFKSFYYILLANCYFDE